MATLPLLRIGELARRTGASAKAIRLYEARGFQLTQEMTGETWGKPVTEQCFELSLA